MKILVLIATLFLTGCGMTDKQISYPSLYPVNTSIVDPEYHSIELNKKEQMLLSEAQKNLELTKKAILMSHGLKSLDTSSFIVIGAFTFQNERLVGSIHSCEPLESVDEVDFKSNLLIYQDVSNTTCTDQAPSNNFITPVEHIIK